MFLFRIEHNLNFRRRPVKARNIEKTGPPFVRGAAGADFALWRAEEGLV